MNAECFTVSEDYNLTSPVIDPILNQSVLVSRIAEMNVHDNLVERLGKVSGEDSNVSEDIGSGFFIDFDDLVQASGVSGKSKPGVTAKHLSRIWRIDESTAGRTIEVTSQLMKHCSPELTESLETISGSFGSDLSLGGDAG